MKPLIQITTIPIAYEVRTEKARYERHEGTAKLEISGSQNGKMQIKSQAIKLNLDTYEPGNVAFHTALGTGENGKISPVTYQATVSMDQNGKLLLKGELNDNLNNAKIAQASSSAGSPQANQTNQADLTIWYEMDRMNFDMKVANGNFEFIPGNINIEITQYPDVQIEYVGGPIYVPPSADPNYESVDVKA